MTTPQTGLRMTKFLIVQSNTYNDQMSRPFSTNFDGHLVAQFKEATHHGSTYNPTALAGVAGAFLRPQAEATAMVAIPNGWDQRRFRFSMEFETATAFQGSLRQVVTGYTDHPGATADGQAMDQNMRLYFNNSIHLQAAHAMTPHGAVETLRVADASHVLFPGQGTQFNGQPTGLQTMRPEDVIGSISTQVLSDANVVDCRSSLDTAGIKKSRRNNLLAPEYVAKTMTAIDQAHKLADSTADHATIYESARATVRETLTTHDFFLSALNQFSSTFRYHGYVTYGELCRLFPETEHVRTIVLPGPTQRMTAMPSRGMTESWTMPTQETVVATILANAIPAVMMDCMLTKVTFVATNQTLNGQPDLQIREAASFTSGIDMSPYLERFRVRILQEVLADITRNNMFSVNLAITCNVLADTMVQVSLDGGHPVDYVTPSFCDGLFAPIITSTPHALSTVAHDMDMLFNNVGQNHAVTQYSPMMAGFGDFGGNDNGNGGAAPAAPVLAVDGI